MPIKRMNLLENEKENLTLAWVLVSEEVETQIRNEFWVKVRNVFNGLMGC